MLYPCYSVLQREKMKYYLAKASFMATETCADTNIQTLLNLPVNRLVMHLEDILDTLSEEER